MLNTIEKQSGHLSEIAYITNLLKFFLRDFGMSWLARGSLSFFSLILKKYSNRKLIHIFADSYFNGDVIKFGLFVAAFFTSFKYIDKKLRNRSYNGFRYGSFVAGGISALISTAISPKTTINLSCYLMFRALHSLLLHNWKLLPPQLASHLKHGNTALFCLCVGQLMYCFILEPYRLDSTYLNYLYKVAYFHPYTFEATRNLNTQSEVDYSRLSELANRSIGPEDIKATMLPCDCMHPNQSHLERVIKLFLMNLRDVFPVYTGLYTVPLLLLKGPHMISNASQLNHLFLNILRSSTFISAIIGLYQLLLCTQRSFLPVESKYWYWIMGVIAALAVLIEKEGRRTELALYLLPKATMSLLYGFLPKQANYLIFALAMSIIMVSQITNIHCSIFTSMNRQALVRW
jgi:hypothetical protein